MACGVPVIGSAYGGLKDTIVNNHTGFLMPTWVTANGIRMDMNYGIKKSLDLLNNTESYQLFSINIVKYYVSNKKLPVTKLIFLVKLSAPLKKIDNHRYKLCDDAWPAVYKFSSLQENIIQLCRSTTSVQTLLKNSIKLKDIYELIKIGVLVYSLEEK